VFIAGSEPQVECDQHVTVSIDRRTGEPATASTPAADVVEKVYWVPPPELREWARAHDIPHLASSSTRSSADPSTVSEAALRAGSPTRQLVALTSPDPGAVFTLASFMPREHQRIEVQTEVYTEEWPQRVTLYADGQVLATLSQPPYRALWTLEAGEHTFHALAVAHDGSLIRSEPTTVFVETEQ
jgi:hypothetical protein